MSIDSVMPSNHLILSCPLLLLPSIFPSIKVFSNVSALHIRWPKYWSFTFSISPSNEQSGLSSWLLGGCHLTVCSCELFMILQRGGDRQQAPWCLFHKGINPILGGANTHDIFWLLPKGPSPNTIPLEVRASTYECGGKDHRHSVHNKSLTHIRDSINICWMNELGTPDDFAQNMDSHGWPQWSQINKHVSNITQSKALA